MDTTLALRLEGELTIYTASAQREHLLRELSDLNGLASTGVTLDLSAATEVDSAGLQLILATLRHVGDAGSALRIINPSPAFTQAAGLLGLDGLLGLARS